jgi:hypothetical protein
MRIFGKSAQNSTGFRQWTVIRPVHPLPIEIRRGRADETDLATAGASALGRVDEEISPRGFGRIPTLPVPSRSGLPERVAFPEAARSIFSGHGTDQAGSSPSLKRWALRT